MEYMVNINDINLLLRFGNRLGNENYERFDSKFISIVNILKNNLQISEAIRSGSLGKGTKVSGYGDLDITFTIYSPPKTNIVEMRREVERILKSAFPNNSVQLGHRSVKITFSNDLQIDVVYLSYQEFQTQKSNLVEVKYASNEVLSIIRLIKYWKEAKNINIRSMDIENVTLWIASSKTQSFINILSNTISEFGYEPNSVISFLKSKAG